MCLAGGLEVWEAEAPGFCPSPPGNPASPSFCLPGGRWIPTRKRRGQTPETGRKDTSVKLPLNQSGRWGWGTVPRRHQTPFTATPTQPGCDSHERPPLVAAYGSPREFLPCREMELLAHGRTFSAFVGTLELATATPFPTPAAAPKSTGLATKCAGASTGMHGPFLLQTRPQAARINPRPSPLPAGPRPSSILPGTPSPTTRAELSEAQGGRIGSEYSRFSCPRP